MGGATSTERQLNIAGANETSQLPMTIATCAPRQSPPLPPKPQPNLFPNRHICGTKDTGTGLLNEFSDPVSHFLMPLPFASS